VAQAGLQAVAVAASAVVHLPVAPAAVARIKVAIAKVDRAMPVEVRAVARRVVEPTAVALRVTAERAARMPASRRMMSRHIAVLATFNAQPLHRSARRIHLPNVVSNACRHAHRLTFNAETAA
jgi:hypothetical protein